jgi:hypothetical protein
MVTMMITGFLDVTTITGFLDVTTCIFVDRSDVLEKPAASIFRKDAAGSSKTQLTN